MKKLIKKRPKSADYIGPPGGKTPLGTKIPPLSKTEKQIGISLELKASELINRYKSATKSLLTRRNWRCTCGFDADFILKKQYPERRKNIDGYFQCSKCGNDVDVY